MRTLMLLVGIAYMLLCMALGHALFRLYWAVICRLHNAPIGWLWAKGDVFATREAMVPARGFSGFLRLWPGIFAAAGVALLATQFVYPYLYLTFPGYVNLAIPAIIATAIAYRTSHQLP